MYVEINGSRTRKIRAELLLHDENGARIQNRDWQGDRFDAIHISEDCGRVVSIPFWSELLQRMNSEQKGFLERLVDDAFAEGMRAGRNEAVERLAGITKQDDQSLKKQPISD